MSFGAAANVLGGAGGTLHRRFVGARVTPRQRDRTHPRYIRNPFPRPGRAGPASGGRNMLEELKNKLGHEIERLLHELQVVLPKAIQKAVEHGDLRENAEYKAALEKQQQVQARLNHLTRRMSELSRIDLSDIPSDRVSFGSRVTVVDMRTRETETYTLAFGDDVDIDSGQISMASALGQALLGKKKGDKVSVQLPRGERKLHVKELVTLPQMVDNHNDQA